MTLPGAAAELLPRGCTCEQGKEGDKGKGRKAGFFLGVRNRFLAPYFSPGLKQLQRLDLRKTKVTGKGKAGLKKALPKLVIIG